MSQKLNLDITFAMRARLLVLTGIIAIVMSACLLGCGGKAGIGTDVESTLVAVEPPVGLSMDKSLEFPIGELHHYHEGELLTTSVVESLEYEYGQIDDSGKVEIIFKGVAYLSYQQAEKYNAINLSINIYDEDGKRVKKEGIYIGDVVLNDRKEFTVKTKIPASGSFRIEIVSN